MRVVIELQLLKAFIELWSFVRATGIFSVFRATQPKKAFSPRDVLFDGIEMKVRPLQPENDIFSMEVTLEGMVMEVSEMQLRKVSLFMLVSWLPSSNVIFFKPVQFKKAESPMLVTFAGMVISVRPLQPEKA